MNVIIEYVQKQMFRTDDAKHTDEQHIAASIDWLRTAYDATNGRGISGLYSMLRGWYAGYPETTGYLIETLLKYYLASGDQGVLSQAINLADWEIEIQLSSGAVRGNCLPSGLGSSPIVFDTGQVIFGWSAMYQYAGIMKYRRAAERAATWLMENQNAAGTWDRYLYKDHCATYNTRVAWAMLLAARDSGRSDLCEAASKFLCWAMSQQTSNGFFNNMGFQAHKMVFSHTLGYTLEGLAGSSEELTDIDPGLSRRLKQSFLQACTSLLASFESSGKVHGEYVKDFERAGRSFDCVCGSIQIAGCFLTAYTLTGDLRYLDASSQLLDEAKSIQMVDAKHPSLRGGFPGSNPIWERYQRFTIVSWAHKFFVDTLLVMQRLQSEVSPLQEKRSQSAL